MTHIAIIEDQIETAQILMQLIENFARENNTEFDIHHFENGERFLSSLSTPYDLVFMDIELPGINGMDTATKLREVNAQCLLIFVTNMAQFAVKGYAVDALDFIVKPIQAYDFSLKLKRAYKKLLAARPREISIKVNGVLKVLRTNDIYYVEVDGHQVIYHTSKGNFETWSTLNEVETILGQDPFSRSNSCYLVNLRYVSEIRTNSIVVHGEELQTSRRRHKDFINDLTDYLGRGGIRKL